MCSGPAVPQMTSRPLALHLPHPRLERDRARQRAGGRGRGGHRPVDAVDVRIQPVHRTGRERDGVGDAPAPVGRDVRIGGSQAVFREQERPSRSRRAVWPHCDGPQGTGDGDDDARAAGKGSRVAVRRRMRDLHAVRAVAAHGTHPGDEITEPEADERAVPRWEGSARGSGEPERRAATSTLSLLAPGDALAWIQA